MKVFKAGTKVKTKVGGIKGMITGVCIRSNDIDYSVRYAKDGGLDIMWLYDYEIELDSDKQRTGFMKDDTPEDIKLIEI